jgi:hypothetical protein
VPDFLFLHECYTNGAFVNSCVAQPCPWSPTNNNNNNLVFCPKQVGVG